MTLYYYEADILPAEFEWPEAFVSHLSQNPVPYHEPWYFLAEFPKNADYWLAQVRAQFPERALVPFAKRETDDDVACFDVNASGEARVHIVHMFASPGWEHRGSYADFDAWLTAAKAESAEHLANDGADEDDD